MEEQKNYPQLINAFENSKFLLNIVGSGTKEKELKSLAKKKNTNCNFLGNIEHNKLLEIYSEYKIFITATLYEGHPKTILEAMANGCVVVAPNIDNISEIIDGDLNGILFDPNNDNLLRLVKAIIEDNEKMDNISNNSISYVKKYFSLEIAVKNEESDYIKSIST